MTQKERISFQRIIPQKKDLDCVRYLDCTFSHVNFDDKRFYNCRYLNCRFENCSFYGAWLGLYKKGACGEFINCSFEKCSFKYAQIGSALFKEALFSDCNFTNANFNGAQLFKVKFTGKVSFCDFYYQPIYYGNDIFYFFENSYIKLHPNKMEDVDFSGAKLLNVSFNNGIKFDKINFGEAEYILLPNDNVILSSLFADIQKLEGFADEVNFIIQFITAVSGSAQKKNQKLLYFDKLSLWNKEENSGTERIYNAMKKYSQS